MLAPMAPTWVKASEEAAQEVYYHLQQADVESVFTLMSGMVSVQLFSLLAQLLLLGAVLVVVFVVAMRRF